MKKNQSAGHIGSNISFQIKFDFDYDNSISSPWAVNCYSNSHMNEYNTQVYYVKWYIIRLYNYTRFAWGAKIASPPAPHSTLIIEKYSTVTKFLCKLRENVISESHQNLISIWPG